MQALRVTPCASVRPCTAVHAGAVRPRVAGPAARVSAVRRRSAVVRAVQAERPAVDAAAGSTDGLLDVVVVGGGISGLCTAQALVTKHAGAARRVLVTESRDRVGGNITTVSVRCAVRARDASAVELKLACFAFPALPACAAERCAADGCPRRAHTCCAERRGVSVGGRAQQLPGAQRETRTASAACAPCRVAPPAPRLGRRRHC